MINAIDRSSWKVRFYFFHTIANPPKLKRKTERYHLAFNHQCNQKLHQCFLIQIFLSFHYTYAIPDHHIFLLS